VNLAHRIDRLERVLETGIGPTPEEFAAELHMVRDDETWVTVRWDEEVSDGRSTNGSGFRDRDRQSAPPLLSGGAVIAIVLLVLEKVMGGLAAILARLPGEF